MGSRTGCRSHPGIISFVDQDDELPLGDQGFFVLKLKIKYIMSYVPIRSGFTGPSAKIGGSTDYHIDLKLLESLPIGERVKALDALAKQYRSLGRDIEFSNPAVSGKRWNPEANLSDRVQLLNQAAAAHSHSRHPGWQSLDFYVPFRGKSRFDSGAVEDASIFIPGVTGGKVRRGAGGGYGYYSESLNPAGQVIFKVGHGNVDRPEQGNELAIPSAPQLSPAAPQLPPAAPQPQTSGTNAQTASEAVNTEKFLGDYLKRQFEMNLISDILQRKRKDPFAEFQQMMQSYGGLNAQGLSNPLL